MRRVASRSPWFFNVTSPIVVIPSLNIIVFMVMVAAGVGVPETANPDNAPPELS